tara:strand:+ start:273 stop:536 length:264 start_codon:yes stop_codon:yes gene_type:complete
MTQEALKLALEALEWANKEINGWRDDAYGYDAEDQPTIMSAVNAIKEALADPMREVQRLGQEIEQKIGCVNHDCEQCKAQRTEEKNA